MSDPAVAPREAWPGDDNGLAHIGFEEYERAFESYRRCMQMTGNALLDVHLEPVTHTYGWQMPMQAESDARAQACDDEYFADANLRWQSQRQCELAPLWERRRRYILEGLAALGVHIEAHLTYPEVVAAACAAGHSRLIVTAPWEDEQASDDQGEGA